MELQKNGHLEVCKYLMNKVDNKNPAENTGTTPLHCAADSGHLEICKFIAARLITKIQQTIKELNLLNFL